MNGILTKGITLSLGETAGSSTTYTALTGLMECPALGGNAEKVDVTTLADGQFKYIKGLKTVEDLPFKFLYDNSATGTYRKVKSLQGVQDWKVTFPDAATDTGHGTEFTFSGECDAVVDAAPVNGALTFTLTIIPNSEIVVSDPT